MDNLPNGVDTQLAGNDPNISADHKQRISLARAVYSNARVILMDDPMSVVNGRTSKHIFDNVIGPNGMLRNKVRSFADVCYI